MNEIVSLLLLDFGGIYCMMSIYMDGVTYDGAESAAEDETEETPEEKTECHGLFAADAVHKETADYAAGEVEAVYYGLRGES